MNTNDTNIGEGDHEAGRRYQTKTTTYVETTDVTAKAREAARDLDERDADARRDVTSGLELRLTLSKEELAAIVDEVAPVRIHLSGPDEPERWVELEDPRELELIEDVGARLAATGRFHFEAGGVPLADEIDRVRVTLKPSIDTDATGIPTLTLDLDLDEADLATFPKLVDRGVTKVVDRALRADATKLVVPFGQLLSGTGAVSPRVQPLSETRVQVERGSMTVTEDRVIFAVDLGLVFDKTGKPGQHPTA